MIRHNPNLYRVSVAHSTHGSRPPCFGAVATGGSSAVAALVIAGHRNDVCFRAAVVCAGFDAQNHKVRVHIDQNEPVFQHRTTERANILVVQTKTTGKLGNELFRNAKTTLGFQPMVLGMSGCSGTQAVGVTKRELSLGLERSIDAFRVRVKAISVGVINRIAPGILIGIIASVCKGNPALGLVNGQTLALNTTLAVSIGGVVPLLLKRLNQDPAHASGPLLTTVTGLAGLFFVPSLASLMMPWLV